MPQETSQPQGEDPEKIKRKYEALLDTQKKEMKRSQKKGIVLLGTALALAVLFLVFGIIQSFRISGVKKEIKVYEEREETSFETFREVMSLQDQIEEKKGRLLIATKESEALEEALKELQQAVSGEDEGPVEEPDEEPDEKQDEETFNPLLYLWGLAHEVHDYFMPPESQSDQEDQGNQEDLGDQEDQETETAVYRIDQEAVERMTNQWEARQNTIQVLQNDIERLEEQKAALLEKLDLSKEGREEENK